MDRSLVGQLGLVLFILLKPLPLYAVKTIYGPEQVKNIKFNKGNVYILQLAAFSKKDNALKYQTQINNLPPIQRTLIC